MSIISRIARQGSFASTSGRLSTIDCSSHSHFISRLDVLSTDHLGRLPLYDYLNTPDRSQRIATGTLAMGVAVMTRELLEPHTQQTPGMKGVGNYLPVAGRSSFGKGGENGSVRFVGWRQKLRTW